MANSPLPVLAFHPTSGLGFRWTEYHPDGKVGSFDACFGPDGCTLGFQMLIYWEDLSLALQQLLGFSWRDPVAGGGSYLRRLLPWQHPYSNQLWVKSVSSVRGVQLAGTAFNVGPPLGAVGLGFQPNLGPGTVYKYALLTIHFWRPPYYIRSDLDITDGMGNPREYLRYTDKHWDVQVQFISRPSTQFIFSPGQGSASGIPFQGTVGQKVAHMKVRRKWYQLPERGIFNVNVDATPNGLPLTMLYTTTQTTNPITGYVYPAFSPICGCINSPIGGTLAKFTGNTVSGSKVITNISPNTTGLAAGFYVDGVGIPPGNIIASVGGGTQITLTQNNTATATGIAFVAEDPTKMFFGCFTGTLLLEGVELVPRELQLPPSLMLIPSFGAGEAISQQQYDVVFHFDLFDPPRSPSGSPHRGHNLAPYSLDGMWYTVQTQGNVSGTSTPGTPFSYADFSDLFRIL